MKEIMDIHNRPSYTTGQNLLNFIPHATSPFHVVEKSIEQLDGAGFQALDFTSPWNLKCGQSYYTKPYGTTLFAFTLCENFSADTRFRIAAAHTDHPGFRIKANADLIEKNYLKLNTEAYGGVILNTWLDRPLSIAGKVSLKSNDIFHPKTVLVDMKKPLLTIPNLAIHMNREINKGIALNKQTDMSPIFAMLEESLEQEHYFLNYLAAYLNVERSEILDFDLYIYNLEDGCFLGRKEDFISAPRLDNITSVFALLEGMLSPHPLEKDISLIALYDNEEIGSRSKQGADSMLTNILLHKIYTSLGETQTTLYEAIMKSLLLSVDVSHAFHPNYAAKNDPTNVASLNQGVVLKIDSTQKYATDTEAIAIVQQLCQAYEIPHQKFANRSDMTSGSTLGSIASAWLPMKTVDLGIPLLAMHSAREMMGVEDQHALHQLIHAFFAA